MWTRLDTNLPTRLMVCNGVKRKTKETAFREKDVSKT